MKTFCNFHLSLSQMKKKLLEVDKAECEKNGRNCDWNESYQESSWQCSRFFKSAMI